MEIEPEDMTEAMAADWAVSWDDEEEGEDCDAADAESCGRGGQLSEMRARATSHVMQDLMPDGCDLD
jgi:hypothetical protein